MCKRECTVQAVFEHWLELNIVTSSGSKKKKKRKQRIHSQRHILYTNTASVKIAQLHSLHFDLHLKVLQHFYFNFILYPLCLS